MDQQELSTVERRPDQAARPMPEPPTGVVEPRSARRAAALISVAGVVVALLVVVLSHATVRWSDEPLAWLLVSTTVGLLVLAVLAVLAGRRGELSTFVVIALLLPFASTASALSGLGGRVEDGIRTLFSADSGWSALTWGDGEQPDEGDAAAEAAEEATPFGQEGSVEGFTVVVDGFACTQTLPEVAENPSRFDGGAGQLVDAKAPDGQQFCVVSSTWRNTGRAPQQVSGWSTFTGVATAEGTMYGPVGDDNAFSTQMTAQQGYEGADVNPGDAASVRSVFTVAADLEPTHAVVEQFSLEEPEVWFALG